MRKVQLRKAAEEFVRRCNDDNEDLSFVLVSRNCKDMPRRDFELEALQSIKVSKLWYALTKTKDLLIIKYAYGLAYSEASPYVGVCAMNFAKQFDTEDSDPLGGCLNGKLMLLSGTVVAPDFVLDTTYPDFERGIDPEQLRASLVLEVEYEHRWPSLLLERLSEYTQQEEAGYVMGIKVYERSGDPIPGEKRKFAAIAVLWRRGDTQREEEVEVPFVGAWSFGTCALDPLTKATFCRQRGLLQQIQQDQIKHPTEHTTESDTIVIPKANLLQGVVDQKGDPIIIRDDHQDLTIDLGDVRDILDHNLPP